MAPGGIVPSLDELEDGHARLRLGLELAPVEQLTFKCGEDQRLQKYAAIPDRNGG